MWENDAIKVENEVNLTVKQGGETFEIPFGGWKFSGIGTGGVRSTFEEMSRI